jgi:hypothetical protein
MIFTYWPVSNQLFQSEPLTLWCWLRVIAIAGIIFFIVEAEKAVNR